MRYTVDKNKTESAYMQLYEQMREDITGGLYPYGTRMPSKRTVAQETGVSVITVEHTYAILSDEGYIEPRERSGFYVIYRDVDFFGSTGTSASVAWSLGKKLTGDSFTGDSLTSGHRTGAPAGNYLSEDKLTENKLPVNDLREADLEIGSDMSGRWQASQNLTRGRSRTDEQMPYGVVARTMRRVLSFRGEKVLERSPSGGLPGLRSAIAAYLGRARGIHVLPEQIIIGSGSEYLYSLIVQVLGRDRIFALEDPSYEKIRRMYEVNGVRCEMLRMGPEGILSSELKRSKASVLHVTPYNSYPSGVTAAASKRREYINWATSRGGTIIEDDFDSEFTVSSKPEDTLFSLEPEKTVIYMNTFTQTIGPSVRIGYMILPLRMTEVFREKVGFYSSTVPTFEQYVLTELIESGEFERHINRVRRNRRRWEHNGREEK